MLIQRYLNTYWYLSLSQISRRSLQNLYLYYGVYTCSEVPVAITEITERILVLRNLFLYGSTCKYYKTYTGTSYLILVLRSISWSYGTYTCIIKLILVFQILYLYYKTYTYFTNTGVPVGTTELILILLIREYPWVLQRLIRYRSTRRYYRTYTKVHSDLYSYSLFSVLSYVCLTTYTYHKK